MKAFISWSGDKSKRVAELLKDWIPKVTPSVELWLSSQDIDSGSQWFAEITTQLADTTLGIICLTNENKNKPWILFESGALAKGLNKAHVNTLLVDLKSEDLENPLAQFNHTFPKDKASVLKLINNLNDSSSAPLPAVTLPVVFEAKWDEFRIAFEAIITDTSNATIAPHRDLHDMVSEILDSVRSIDKRVTSLEQISPSSQPTPLISLPRRNENSSSNSYDAAKVITPIVANTINSLLSEGFPPHLVTKSNLMIQGKIRANVNKSFPELISFYGEAIFYPVLVQAMEAYIYSITSVFGDGSESSKKDLPALVGKLRFLTEEILDSVIAHGAKINKIPDPSIYQKIKSALSFLHPSLVIYYNEATLDEAIKIVFSHVMAERAKANDASFGIVSST
jgi:hypothetical protein